MCASACVCSTSCQHSAKRQFAPAPAENAVFRLTLCWNRRLPLAERSPSHIGKFLSDVQRDYFPSCVLSASAARLAGNYCSWKQKKEEEWSRGEHPQIIIFRLVCLRVVSCFHITHTGTRVTLKHCHSFIIRARNAHGRKETHTEKERHS